MRPDGVVSPRASPMAHGGSTKLILLSLGANAGIALAKTVAAVITHSGAMLAEALHSFSDCANQLLLLVGNKQAQRPPSEAFPLGQGRAAYFWSFVVALMLFFGGGMVAIWEGVEKVRHSEAVHHVSVALAVLVFSLALEGFSLAACVKSVREASEGRGFVQTLRETKDADLVVVTGENLAAVLGLSLALVFLVIAWKTGNGLWDGVGSIAIGVVLVGVAVFLAKESQSLLLGERAEPAVEAAVREALAEDARLGPLMRLLSIQQGPGEVVLAMKIGARPELSAAELIAAMNAFEQRVRAKRPEVKWQFVEPDSED